jgi:transposase
MRVRDKWYLASVCDFDDPDLLTPDGVLGVDLGIVNIATDSLGN